MGEFISSFLLNFLAELGDKTQLVSFLLAGSYGLLPASTGVLVAVVLLQGIAVGAGWLFQSLLSNKSVISLIAGIIFLLFGFLTIIKEEKEDEFKFNKQSGYPIFQIALLFFVAELGDKTQIATMVKATTSSSVLLTYLGAVSGFFLSNFIGIFLGNLFKERVEEKKLRLAGAAVFIAFGVFYLVKALLNQAS